MMFSNEVDYMLHCYNDNIRSNNTYWYEKMVLLDTVSSKCNKHLKSCYQTCYRYLITSCYQITRCYLKCFFFLKISHTGTLPQHISNKINELKEHLKIRICENLCRNFSVHAFPFQSL
jgi:hypothetical protein